jgi:hypothetical protein
VSEQLAGGDRRCFALHSSGKAGLSICSFFRLCPSGRRLCQWAGSCWYYLRYIDPGNAEALVSAEAERYWMPVDLYVGGAEHAVLHLLYARFWHKVARRQTDRQ